MLGWRPMYCPGLYLLFNAWAALRLPHWGCGIVHNRCVNSPIALQIPLQAVAVCFFLGFGLNCDTCIYLQVQQYVQTFDNLPAVQTFLLLSRVTLMPTIQSGVPLLGACGLTVGHWMEFTYLLFLNTRLAANLTLAAGMVSSADLTICTLGFPCCL